MNMKAKNLKIHDAIYEKDDFYKRAFIVNEIWKDKNKICLSAPSKCLVYYSFDEINSRFEKI